MQKTFTLALILVACTPLLKCAQVNKEHALPTPLKYLAIILRSLDLDPKDYAKMTEDDISQRGDISPSAHAKIWSELLKLDKDPIVQNFKANMQIPHFQKLYELGERQALLERVKEMRADARAGYKSK